MRGQKEEKAQQVKRRPGGSDPRHRFKKAWRRDSP
jgi:hypothetical protein